MFRSRGNRGRYAGLGRFERCPEEYHNYDHAGEEEENKGKADAEVYDMIIYLFPSLSLSLSLSRTQYSEYTQSTLFFLGVIV